MGNYHLSITKKKIAKPYYKIYSYKIKTAKLAGFHDDYLEIAFGGEVPQTLQSRRWNWGIPYTYIEETYPSSKEEHDERLQLAKKLQSFASASPNKVKVKHSWNSSIMYIETYADYVKILSLVGDYAEEVCEPVADNIIEMMDKLGSIEELRTCYYYGEYKYKIHLRAGWTVELSDYQNLKSQLQDMENVHLNVAFQRLPSDNTTRAGWRYAGYAVACNDEDIASYISFVAGDYVVQITKAVVL